MSKIPTIKLTGTEYQNILDNSIINYGGESIICRTPNPNTLYKFFTYTDDMDPEFAYPNKQAKIQLLYDFSNLEYSVKPISTLEVNGEFLGYEMTRNPFDISLADAMISNAERVNYLHKIRKILDYYKSIGITYGDVRSDNILLNISQGTLKFCDMDNIQIGNYSIDAISEALAGYIDERDVIDETVDSFMFNLLTLEQLSYPDESYVEILNRLNNGIYPQNFHKEAKRVLESMLSPKDYTGETIIQYIKK